MDLRQPCQAVARWYGDDLLRVKLEKLRVEAEDCELISKLATAPKKRQLFKKLATDLRSMARDIEARIPGPPNE